MRVALCSDLLDGELCGMQIALDEFLDCVRQSDHVSKFELIHTKPFGNGAYSAFADVVVKRGRRTGSGYYWSQVAVPRKVGEMQVDLLWWPYQIMPPIDCVVPRVISVWDLAPMTFRDANWSRLAVAIKYKWILVRALKSAAQIICHSKAVADEIMRRFDLSASRISVVYPGLGELFRKALENPEPVNKDGYILYVGTCTARKNVNLLIEAYKLLMDQGVKNQLALLVDGPQKQRTEMFEYATRIGIPAERILILEKKSPTELIEIYRRASVFAFPSLYEGFGLPLIEASAIGLPVVALNRSTMPEVLGGTGVLVDEPKPESFARGLTTALGLVHDRADETALMAREQAARYRWEDAVETTMEILERAADSC